MKVERIGAISLSILCLLILMTISVTVNGQDEGNYVTTETRSFEVKREGFLQILRKISEKYGVPIGIAMVTKTERSGFGERLSFFLKDATLANALDELTQKQGEYVWRFDNEVVRITPKQRTDGLTLDLAGLRIREFIINQEISEAGLRSKILDTPEIREFLNSREVEIAIAGGISIDILSKEDLSIRLQNTSLGDVLDTIVRKSKHRVWIISHVTRGSSSEINIALF